MTYYMLIKSSIRFRQIHKYYTHEKALQLFSNEHFRPTTFVFLHGVWHHTNILTVQSNNSLLHSEAEFASNLSFTYKNKRLSYSKSLFFYSIISLTQAVVHRNYFSSFLTYQTVKYEAKYAEDLTRALQKDTIAETWAMDKYLLGDGGVWSDIVGTPVVGVTWLGNWVPCDKLRFNWGVLLLIPLIGRPSAPIEKKFRGVET